MKRYAAFDPPEYVAWAPDDAERERFVATLTRHPDRAAIIDALHESQLLDLYAGLVRTRLIELFELFDPADPEVIAGRRNLANALY